MADLLEERLTHGGVLLIKDNMEVSGMFLVALLLRKALQNGHRVVLALVDHTFLHYHQMLRKLGCNLGACQDSGQLVVVDVLTGKVDWEKHSALQELYARIHSAVLGSEIATNAPGLNPSEAAPDGNYTGSGSGVQQNGGIHPCLVFCDGLSTLAALVDETGGSFSGAAQGHSSCTLGGGFDSQWTAFCHYLVLMAQGVGLGAASALVALVHSDVDADERWLQEFDRSSDTIVAVQALESGHSADVSGEMIVLRRTEQLLGGDCSGLGVSSGRRRDSVSAFYFRTTDNAVTFVRKKE